MVLRIRRRTAARSLSRRAGGCLFGCAPLRLTPSTVLPHMPKTSFLQRTLSRNNHCKDCWAGGGGIFWFSAYGGGPLVLRILGVHKVCQEVIAKKGAATRG